MYTLDAIRSFTAQLAEAQGVRLTITDTDGTALAGPTEAPDVSGLTSAAGDHRVVEALAGRSGTIRMDTVHGDTLSAYAAVETLGWAVAAEVPADQALEGVTRLRSTVLSLALALGLVLFVGIALLARTLRQRRDADRAVRDREASTDRFWMPQATPSSPSTTSG